MSVDTAERDSSEQSGTLTVAPRGSMVTVARIYHLVVALVGTSALTISLIISAASPVSGGGLNGIIFTLSYFTVWSNIVALIVNWMLAVDPTRDGKLFRWLRMTSLVMIVITGLIYALILAASAHPCGWGIYTNMGYHYIVPWATLLGFLLFGPRPRFTWDLVPKMLVIPVIWLAVTLLHGLMTVNAPGSECTNTPVQMGVNFYPYPFINVNYDGTGGPSPLVPGLEAAGYAGIAINLVLIVILGLLMAMMFLGLDRLLSKGAKPTPLDR
ncbi:MAG: Pr6Pr family membrane protein [Candidatus Nanopelagicales bacterium]